MSFIAFVLLLKWSILLQTLIHLIDRRTGKEVETKYTTGAMVVYHHINAFEDAGHVILDVIAYNDNKLYDMFYLKKSPEASVFSKSTYRRFALPIQPDKVRRFSQIHSLPEIRGEKTLHSNSWTQFAGRCSWRKPGQGQIHNSQCSKGERGQANMPGRGAV